MAGMDKIKFNSPIEIAELTGSSITMGGDNTEQLDLTAESIDVNAYDGQLTMVGCLGVSISTDNDGIQLAPYNGTLIIASGEESDKTVEISVDDFKNMKSEIGAKVIANDALEIAEFAENECERLTDELDIVHANLDDCVEIVDGLKSKVVIPVDEDGEYDDYSVVLRGSQGDTYIEMNEDELVLSSHYPIEFIVGEHGSGERTINIEDLENEIGAKAALNNIVRPGDDGYSIYFGSPDYNDDVHVQSYGGTYIEGTQDLKISSLYSAVIEAYGEDSAESTAKVEVTNMGGGVVNIAADDINLNGTVKVNGKGLVADNGRVVADKGLQIEDAYSIYFKDTMAGTGVEFFVDDLRILKEVRSDANNDLVSNGLNSDVTAPNSGHNVNTGDNAIVFGDANTNGGISSIIGGSCNTNTMDFSIMAGCWNENYGDGYNSIITGNTNINTARGNIVGGHRNEAHTRYSLTAGWENKLFGIKNGNGDDCDSYNVVGGYSNEIYGRANFVAGHDNTVIGNFALVAGRSNTIGGLDGEALSGNANYGGVIVGGYNNVVAGHSSITSGLNNENAHRYSNLFGEGLLTGNNYHTAIGKFNSVSGADVFTVGFGNSKTDRKNLFNIKSNGAIDISGPNFAVNSNDGCFKLGVGLQTDLAGQVVVGRYNVNMGNNTIFAVGGGNSDADRKTVFCVKESGPTEIANQLTVYGGLDVRGAEAIIRTNVVINGNLTVNGTVNGGSAGGSGWTTVLNNVDVMMLNNGYSIPAEYRNMTELMIVLHPHDGSLPFSSSCVFVENSVDNYRGPASLDAYALNSYDGTRGNRIVLYPRIDWYGQLDLLDATTNLSMTIDLYDSYDVSVYARK